MFEPGTTLKLNIVMLIIAAGFFGYALLLAPGPEPAASANSTPAGPTRPVSTQRVPPPATPTTGVTDSPSATASATPPPTPTGTPTPTGGVATPTAPALSEVDVTLTSTPATQHTVAPGEVLSAIAARYDVSVDAIVAANELEDPNRLEVGQVLVIPKP